MAVSNITVPVDADAARIYTNAPIEDQRKLRLLISMWLREFAVSPRPLAEVMDEISEKAQARGLTPNILESLLNVR